MDPKFKTSAFYKICHQILLKFCKLSGKHRHAMVNIFVVEATKLAMPRVRRHGEETDGRIPPV